MGNRAAGRQDRRLAGGTGIGRDRGRGCGLSQGRGRGHRPPHDAQRGLCRGSRRGGGAVGRGLCAGRSACPRSSGDRGDAGPRSDRGHLGHAGPGPAAGRHRLRHHPRPDAVPPGRGRAWPARGQRAPARGAEPQPGADGGAARRHGPAGTFLGCAGDPCVHRTGAGACGAAHRQSSHGAPARDPASPGQDRMATAARRRDPDPAGDLGAGPSHATGLAHADRADAARRDRGPDPLLRPRPVQHAARRAGARSGAGVLSGDAASRRLARMHDADHGADLPCSRGRQLGAARPVGAGAGAGGRRSRGIGPA